MVQTINGRLIFVYASPKNKYYNPISQKLKLSLLGMLIGIFLLPNLAYLAAITPENLIELTNRERQDAGLNSLTANQLLTQAALAKSKTILESQTFKHNINDKKFSSWIRDAGYNYSYAGENLAIDFVTSEGVMEAWKNSYLHKKNILSPYYREVGIAAINGKFQGQDTTVVVQIFGSPAISSVQTLPQNIEDNNLYSNINFLETSLPDYGLARSENLLTHAVLNRELLPAYQSKIILPAKNYPAAAVNKFVIQPEFYKAVNNFVLTYALLTLIYIIFFLYYYYFFKIIKLASV